MNKSNKLQSMRFSFCDKSLFNSHENEYQKEKRMNIREKKKETMRNRRNCGYVSKIGTENSTLRRLLFAAFGEFIAYQKKHVLCHFIVKCAQSSKEFLTFFPN